MSKLVYYCTIFSFLAVILFIFYVFVLDADGANLPSIPCYDDKTIHYMICDDPQNLDGCRDLGRYDDYEFHMQAFQYALPVTFTCKVGNISKNLYCDSDWVGVIHSCRTEYNGDKGGEPR